MKKQYKILIVDDSFQVRFTHKRNISQILIDAGLLSLQNLNNLPEEYVAEILANSEEIVFIEAENSYTAIDVLNNHTDFSFITIDGDMDGGDGDILLEYLRNSHKKLLKKSVVISMNISFRGQVALEFQVPVFDGFEYWENSNFVSIVKKI